MGGTHAKSEAECISQCSAQVGCNHYTWYSKDSQTISEACLFFSSCNNLESCSSGGCFSGKVDCIGCIECPSSDFMDFDPNYGHCYLIESENSLSWGDANRACMAYGSGGSLVSIHSEEETNNILDETPFYLYCIGIIQIIFGLTILLLILSTGIVENQMGMDQMEMRTAFICMPLMEKWESGMIWSARINLDIFAKFQK